MVTFLSSIVVSFVLPSPASSQIWSQMDVKSLARTKARTTMNMRKMTPYPPQA